MKIMRINSIFTKSHKMGIIIPIYNSESYLPVLFNDIASNDYDDIEIVFVINGATDNSKRMCQNYVDKDKRCKLLVQSNQGVSAARNYGISDLKERVNYIGFLDADDRINSQYFQSFADEIEKDPNSDIIIGKIQCVIKPSNTVFFPFSARVYKSNVEIINAFLKFEISTAVWGRIYKSNLLSVSFTHTNINEDFIFNWKVLQNAKKVSIINDSALFCDLDGLERVLAFQKLFTDLSHTVHKNGGFCGNGIFFAVCLHNCVCGFVFKLCHKNSS